MKNYVQLGLLLYALIGVVVGFESCVYSDPYTYHSFDLSELYNPDGDY